MPKRHSARKPTKTAAIRSAPRRGDAKPRPAARTRSGGNGHVPDVIWVRSGASNGHVADVAVPRSPSLSTPRSAPVEGRDIVTKWGGHQALARDGYVPVVRSFLKLGGSLKPHPLSPAESLFVLQLMVHKWDARLPYPAYRTIAQRMGISSVYARRLARKLKLKGYLNLRLRVGKTARFDLQPLFDQLAAQAQAEHDKRIQSADDDA